VTPRAAAALAFALASAAVVLPVMAQHDALLATPDQPVTLRAEAIELGPLLTLLASVGGTELVVGAGLKGTVRNVAFEGVRVEDAFRRVLASEGLEARRVGTRVLVTRGPGPQLSPLPAPPLDQTRPELVVPPGAP
jgi:hypothetical protein